MVKNHPVAILNDTVNGHTSTALAAAVWYVNCVPQDIMHLLITPDNVNVRGGPYHSPPLILAIRHDCLDWKVVQLLFDNHADINAKSTMRGATPLFNAIRRGVPHDILLQLISQQNINIKDLDKQLCVCCLVVGVLSMLNIAVMRIGQLESSAQVIHYLTLGKTVTSKTAETTVH